MMSNSGVDNVTVQNPLRFMPDIIEALKPVGVRKIIAFGSSVTGSFDRDSDLDLLVVLDETTIPTSYDEKLRLRAKVRRAVGNINREIPMDLFVYTSTEYDRMCQKPSMFVREIHDTGKVVYERVG